MQSIKPTLSRELMLSLNEYSSPNQTNLIDSYRDFASDYTQALSKQTTIEPRSNQTTIEPRSKQTNIEPRSNQTTIEPKKSSKATHAVIPYKSFKKDEGNARKTSSFIKPSPQHHTESTPAKSNELQRPISRNSKSTTNNLGNAQETTSPDKLKQMSSKASQTVNPASHDQEENREQNKNQTQVIDFNQACNELQILPAQEETMNTETLLEEFELFSEQSMLNVILQTVHEKQTDLNLLITKNEMINSDSTEIETEVDTDLDAALKEPLELNEITNFSDELFPSTLLSSLSIDKLMHTNSDILQLNASSNVDHKTVSLEIKSEILFEEVLNENIEIPESEDPFNFCIYEQSDEELMNIENQANFSYDPDKQDALSLQNMLDLDSDDSSDVSMVPWIQFELSSHEDENNALKAPADFKTVKYSQEIKFDEIVVDAEAFDFIEIDSSLRVLLEQDGFSEQVNQIVDTHSDQTSAQISGVLVDSMTNEPEQYVHGFIASELKFDPSLNTEKVSLKLNLNVSDSDLSNQESDEDSSFIYEEKYKFLKLDGFKVDKYRLDFSDKYHFKAQLAGHFQLTHEHSTLKKASPQFNSWQSQDLNTSPELNFSKQLRYSMQMTPNKTLAVHQTPQPQPTQSELVQALHDKFAPLMKKHILMMSRNGVSSAELQLDPPELGTIHVRIQVQGEQTQILFNASNLQTREMIDQSTARLRDLLQQQGFSLHDDSSNQQNQDRHNRGHRRHHVNLEEANIENSDLRSELLYQQRLVDFYA